jgi:chromosomal replication initiator protein
MKAIWEEIKNQISSELPKNTFSLWIRPITFIDKRENRILLGCPNRFSRNWVTENYLGLIQEKLDNALSEHCEVVLNVAPVNKEAPPADFIRDFEQLTLPNITPNGRDGRLRLNTDFTFDRFVVGPCNEFAFFASKALAQGIEWNYDSLMILSNTGLGKSHLSQAVGHAILKKNPERQVYYVTAEDFTNEMIFFIRSNRMEEFKNKYRRLCDVLILEEIHFLGGKEKTQVELGYTLDALANSKKNIVFTSSLPPKDIPRISKELTSRLASGLVTTIGDPDYETRLKILTRKASDLNIVLTDEIKHLLASRLKRDIRQLESSLKCLKARSEFLNEKLDLALAKDVSESLASGENSITTEQVKEIVCKYYRIDPEMLDSRSRKKIYALPRNVYVYLCRRHTDETIEDIGKSVNRSHSMVLYASEVVERKIETDKKMRNQIEFLGQKLRGMRR